MVEAEGDLGRVERRLERKAFRQITRQAEREAGRQTRPEKFGKDRDRQARHQPAGPVERKRIDARLWWSTQQPKAETINGVGTDHR